ncbi:hypothetical protein WAI453_010046 [Rhynchosporium graminicola]|uniref:Uncharacterized protein n=1 Tax=Rhynchosporium graminicola TaxID=2792576 RepID=A0A1E1KEZ7_9HELO|nr:uncharacterized protein RCO7_04808 [Rhynchosporium commune]
MRVELCVLVIAAQWLPVSAQVVFSRPAQGDVISGNVPFVLTVSESTSAPFFNQMTNFSLYLMAGSFSSPITLFIWDISTTNPSTVDNSVNIPSSAGTNAKDSYFLGLRGSIISVPTLTTTYFSPIFTLENMTGAASLIAPGITRTLTAATGTQTQTGIATSSSLARAFGCLDPGTGKSITVAIEDPSANSLCVRSASSMMAVLATATRSNSAASIARTSTVTVPTPRTSVSSPTSAVDMSSPGIAVTSFGAQATAAASNNFNQSATPSKVNGRLVYIVIIVIFTFLAPIICLWLFLRYRRRAHAQSLSKTSFQEPSSPFKRFRPIISSLKGVIVLFKRKDQPPRHRRKRSDAEKGHGLEVDVTQPLRHFSTRNSEIPKTPRTPKTPGFGRRIMQQRAFEEASDTRRASQRTILAELEGDSIIPPMPAMPGAEQRPKYGRESVASEIGRWRTESDQAFESFDAQRKSEALAALKTLNDTEETESNRYSLATTARRTVILSEGQEIRVVRGKDVANIVTCSKKAHQHSQSTSDLPPPMPILTTTLNQYKEGGLPTRPHDAHLSLMHNNMPKIPVSRFSMRSASVSDLPHLPLSDFLSRSRSRISRLDHENGNGFSEGQASVVIAGSEEERRERLLRKERRERKREELLRGGVGGSAAIDLEIVKWVKNEGPIGTPTFGGAGAGLERLRQGF